MYHEFRMRTSAEDLKIPEDPETEMKSTKIVHADQSAALEAQKLEVRYGDIGISAVAAAMRFRGNVKPAAADDSSAPKAKELATELA